MASAPTQTRFVRRVREEMSRQDLSIRGLARRIDPDNIDRARRNLHRWLDEGISPGRASRAEVATALRIEQAELEDDDEESDPVSSLTHALNAIVEAAVAKALHRVPA